MDTIATTKASLFDRIAEFWRITVFTARMRRESKERYMREQERRERDTRIRKIESHVKME
jgi:hypothetical protein